MTACAIRSHLAEFGFITGQGIGRVEPLLDRLAEEGAERLPGEVRDILLMLAYLRHLLFIGARNVIRYPKAREAAGAAWIEGLVARRSRTVAAVALANKMARIAWAMMTTGEAYRSAREATA
jgi:hypothetical protein